jgi:hypothetical protein
MLFAEPTKRGMGIGLYGDYNDLRNLHQTVHALCGSDRDDLDHQKESTLHIAYELRKAYEGQRETIKHPDSYYGVKIAWPIILFYTSYLRQCAGFCPTSKEHQANLYRLEHCVENALLKYDFKIGAEIIESYSRLGFVSEDYLFAFVDDITYQYLYGGGSGKLNFKRLPKLLWQLHELSDSYKEFAEYMKQQAQIHSCSVYDLHDSRDWSEIKW